MPNISFASGGDADTLDFVAYVAKDKAGVRSCFVLECGGGLAQDVITTIGRQLGRLRTSFENQGYICAETSFFFKRSTSHITKFSAPLLIASVK